MNSNNFCFYNYSCWEEWDLNLRNTNVADLQSAAFDRLAILPFIKSKIIKQMYNLLKKKQNANALNVIKNNYELLLITKKQKKNKIIKDADISFPVFSKGINNFTLNGMKIRKKKKTNHINQTITIQTKLSKQLIKLNVNTQCPLITIK